MGGLTKKPVIGYKYYLGVHFVYVAGAIDKLIELRFAGKTAWRGAAKDTRSFINKPNLFGGKKRQGGISGWFDVMMGGKTQDINDYLLSKLGDQVSGGKIPAFRGVTSLVFRRMYLGNNPYLKPPEAVLQRVYTTPDDEPNWYLEKAAISNIISVSGSAIYIAMDGSASMLGARMDVQKASVVNLLKLIRDNFDEKNDIHIILWSGVVLGSIQKRKCKTSDYDALIAWVETLDAESPFSATGTNFEIAVSEAKAFFDGDQTFSIFGNKLNPFGVAVNFAGIPLIGDFIYKLSGGDRGSRTLRRVVVFMTDGEPTPPATAVNAAATLNTIDGLDVYGINIDAPDTQYTALLDNTPDDGVPVVNSADPDALLNIFKDVFSGGVDYNPIHFLRDVHLFPSVGTTNRAGNIGDSYRLAADVLYDEHFGISLEFKNPYARRENAAEIERHIDARSYKDRITGKNEVKLIRQDYDPNDLFVLDDSNVSKWGRFIFRDEKNLVNRVTVLYTDPKTFEVAALTVTNIARVQLSGRIINAESKYLGVRSFDIASRLGHRDLAALSSPLRSGPATAFNLPSDYNIGWPVRVVNPRQNIDDVYRIVDLTEGGTGDEAVQIQLVEESYSFDAESILVAPTTLPVSDAQDPQVVDMRFVEEAPFFELVQAFGQTDAEEKLTNDPTIGYLNAAGVEPTETSINALIYVDAGGGYDGDEVMDFSFGARLRNDLTGRADHTRILIDMDVDFFQIQIGSLALIDNEYVRIDAIEAFDNLYALDDVYAVENLYGNYAIVTVGRGCLDTVPVAHSKGAALIFWGNATGSDGVEYYEGEDIDVKLLTTTSNEILDDQDAPTNNLEFKGRANRPYAPGQFQVGGSYEPALAAGVLNITWAHRDRLTQTTGVYEDHDYGNIGPEAGVTYILKAELLDAGDSVVADLINHDVGAITAYDLDLDDAISNIYATANVYDLADVYKTSYPSATMLKLSITSVREGHQCWQSPVIMLPIFAAPTNLVLTSDAAITFVAPSNLTATEI